VTKIIAIKATQYLGVASHGGEAHTIKSLIEIFHEGGYQVDLIGGEIKSADLGEDRHFLYLKYLGLPQIIRTFLHIPISIISLMLYCKQHKPDLLFCTGGVFYNGLAVVICGFFFGIKTLVRTAEDHFNYWKYVSTLTGKIKHFLVTNLVSKVVLKNSDYVLTVGVASEAYFKKALNRADHIYGVPGPVRQNSFYVSDDRLARKKALGYEVDEKLVLYVGAISGVKGTDLLPDVIKSVVSRDQKVKFLIIGSETERKSGIVKDLLDSGGKNIKIIPPMANDKLIDYYQVADVLVFTTRVGVGYGLVNIEAALSGLPVIAINPGLDVEWFLGERCLVNTAEDMVNKIVNSDFYIPTIPPSFLDENIKKSHLALMNDIL